MPIRRLATATAAVLIALAPVTVAAATDEELDTLYDALGIEELIEIVAEEGEGQGEELREQMFPERGGAGWSALVTAIYETDPLESAFRKEFDAALADTDVTPLLAFYADETGRKIVRLEADARRAIISEEVEEAAKTAYATLLEEDAARADQLDDFVVVNDLIERNVAGALNSSLAFYRGLGDGGGFEMGESDMLSEVWSREPEYRADTESWVFAYLTLAYDALEDEELASYVDLARTREGRDLNAALFAGFHGIFQDVGYRLGRAASTFMVGEEL